MGLGAVLEKVAPQGSLKKLLEQWLVEKKDVPPLTPEGYVRVSSFAEMCPRQEVICSVDSVVRKRDVDPNLQMIFTHGHALHWGLQNIILPRVGCLIGVWKCEKCFKAYGYYDPTIPLELTMVRRPEACDCGSEELIYEEISLLNEEYRLTGHPDGIIAVPGLPGLGLFEGKSIGGRNAWGVKTTPIIGHVIQTQLYMWMLGLKWAKILYWDKAGNGMDALTEHHVPYCQETVNIAKKTLQSLWTGIESGMLPARICENEECPKAKDCPVRERCFDTKEGVEKVYVNAPIGSHSF